MAAGGSCGRAAGEEGEEPESRCPARSPASAHCQHRAPSAPCAMDIIFGRNKKEQPEPVRAKVTGERFCVNDRCLWI